MQIDIPETLLAEIDALGLAQLQNLQMYLGFAIRAAEKYAPKKRGPKPKPDAAKLPLGQCATCGYPKSLHISFEPCVFDIPEETDGQERA